MPTSTSSNVLNIVVDQRFKRCPAGRIWTHTPPSYRFFESALSVFDRVRVIGRTLDVAAPPAKAQAVTGTGVEVVPFPSYVGPINYARNLRAIHRCVDHAARLDGCFLLRIPSQIGFSIAAALRDLDRPFAVELLTDPSDFFAPGVAPHGLAFLFRPYFRSQSRACCSEAIAVNYVTGTATRNANPPNESAWSASVSDVDLPADAFLDPPQDAAPRNSSAIEVVSVGFLDLLYKGQDVLIRAVSECRDRGMAVNVTFVGDGQQKGTLLGLAQELGVSQQVKITGALGGPGQVRDYLRRSDVFVLPSRAEGIPRALLEAMAAALPAVGSSVGAMPDLLEPRWIVKPGSVEDLRDKLIDFAQVREQWAGIGRRNQEVVRSFESSKLLPQRRAFYEAIRERSLAFVQGRDQVRGHSHAA